MKKYASLALVLVLTAAMLVGCGCTNQNKDLITDPTVLPTNEEIWNSTETTQSTRESSMPEMLDTTPTESFDRGNGPLEDETTSSTNSTETTGGAMEGRSRSGMNGTR